MMDLREFTKLVGNDGSVMTHLEWTLHTAQVCIKLMRADAPRKWDIALLESFEQQRDDARIALAALYTR